MRGLRGARRSGVYPRRRSLAVDARNSRNSGKSTTAPRCACPDKCGSPACRWRHCRIPQERTDSRSDRVFCFPACGRLLGIGRAASTARLRTCALSPLRSQEHRQRKDKSSRAEPTPRTLGSGRFRKRGAADAKPDRDDRNVAYEASPARVASGRSLCRNAIVARLARLGGAAPLSLGESGCDRALPLVLAFSVVVHVALRRAAGGHAISRRVASLSLGRAGLRRTVQAPPDRTLMRCPIGVREPPRLLAGAPPGV